MTQTEFLPEKGVQYLEKDFAFFNVAADFIRLKKGRGESRRNKS